MHYDAVAVGPLDLAAGVSFLKQGDGSKFPWLSANLMGSDNQPLFQTSCIKTVGEKHIGIIALTGPVPALPDDVHSVPWRSVLPSLLQSLGKKCDHLIVLSNLTAAEDYEMANEFPQISIIISADPKFNNLNPTIATKTLITQTAGQGKYLGSIRISWGAGSGWQTEPSREHVDMNDRGAAVYEIEGGKTRPSSFAARFIALASPLPDNTAVSDIITRVKQQINQENNKIRLQESAVTNTAEPKINMPDNFIGSQICVGCHKNQVDFWQSTAHSRAYSTLVRAGQSNNPECLLCHVTHDRGPFTREGVAISSLLALPPSMQSVGCEMCHGPAKAHAELPDQIKVTLNPSLQVCLTCHDDQHSKTFNYSEKVTSIRCPNK